MNLKIYKLILPLFLVLSPLTHVFAQAPGGISTNLAWWFKGDAGLTKSGNNVTQWNDQSASGLNVVQATAGAQPISTQLQNFNPVVSFDGNDDYLRNAVGYWKASTGNTKYNIFVAYTGYCQFGPGGTVFGEQVSSGTQTLYLPKNFTAFPLVSGNGINGGSMYNATDVPFVQNIPFIWSTRYNSNATAVNSFRSNAKDVSTSATAAAFNGSNKPLDIGAAVNSALYGAGSIGEVLMYSNDLTSTQRKQVESYLAFKWGITLDQTSPGQDYIAGDGTTAMWTATTGGVYNNNIAGIGRDDASGLNQKQGQSVKDKGLGVATQNQSVVSMSIAPLAATNTANTGSFTSNNIFQSWGDDGGSVAYNTSVLVPAGINASTRMGRIWKVQETGAMGTVNVYILKNFAQNNTNTHYLAVSNSAGFDATSQYLPMTTVTVGGIDYLTTSVDFTNGQYFTVATNLKGVVNFVRNGTFDQAPACGAWTGLGAISATPGAAGWYILSEPAGDGNTAYIQNDGANASITQTLNDLAGSSNATIKLKFDIGAGEAGLTLASSGTLAIKLGGVTYVTFANSTVAAPLTATTANGAIITNYPIVYPQWGGPQILARDVVLTIPNFTSVAAPVLDIYALLPSSDFKIDNLRIEKDIDVPSCIAVDAITQWLKPESATGATTGTIWTDRSVNRFNEVVSGAAPTVTAAGANFNPTMTFTGTQSLTSADYTTTCNPLAITSAGEVMTVVQDAAPAAGTDGHIFSYGGSGTNTYTTGTNSINEGFMTSAGLAWTGSTGAITTAKTGIAGLVTPVTTGNYNLYNTYGMAGDWGVGFNGTLNTTATNTISTAGTPYIGRNSAGTFFKGNISEIMLFNRKLTTTERQTFDTYLGLKYGITLTHNYVSPLVATTLYDISTYNKNVAGIGRNDCLELTQKQSQSMNTNAKDNMVTMGLNTIAATNAANTGTFSANNSFLIWGDDGAGVTTTQTTDMPAGSGGCYSRLPREWKVQKTGTVAAEQVKVDLNSTISLTGKTASDIAMLVDEDGNGDFTNGTTHGFTATSLVGGIATFNNVVWDADGSGADVYTIVFKQAAASAPAMLVANGILQATTQLACKDLNNSLQFVDNATTPTAKYLTLNTNGNTGTFTAVADNNSTPTSNQQRTNGTLSSTALSNRMYTVSDAVTGNYTVNGGMKVRLYYSAADSTATVGNLAPGVTGLSAYQWFMLPGSVSNVLAAQTPTGVTGATLLTPSSYGVEDGVNYVEFDNITSLGTFGSFAKTTFVTQPPVAQNITTEPMNSSNGATGIGSLLATDPQGAAITSYNVTALPATGVLYYCDPACTVVVANSTVITDPAKLQFDPAQGTTPSSTETFTYTATSTNGLSNVATVTIPIFNTAPIAQSMTTGPVAAGNPGAAVPLPMLQGVDKDGSISTYTVSPVASGGGLTYCTSGTLPGCSATSISAATPLTAAQAATLQFTPTGNTIGTSTFTFTVTDNNGNVSNAAEVNIPVTTGGAIPASNLAPVTQDIVTAPITNTTGATYLPALVGSDPDGTVSYYKLTGTLPTAAQGILEYCTTPGSCAAVNTATNYTNPANFRFTPAAANAGGNVTFDYTATDNLGLVSNTSTVTIPVINPVPTAFNVVNNPIAGGSILKPVNGPAAVDNGTIAGYQFTVVPDPATQGTLYYCTTPVGGCTPATPVTTASILTPAQAATLALTPAASFTGTIALPYKATDNNSLVSNSATLMIPVQKTNPASIPPVAKDYAAASVNSNTTTPVAIASALNATDADGTVSNYVIAKLPPANQGVLSYCTTGTLPGCTLTPVVAGNTIPAIQAATLSFLPNSAYTGQVNFTYTAVDNNGLVGNVANVNIPVKNLPPVAQPVNVTSVTPGGIAVPVAITAADPDGSVASYTFSNVPSADQATLKYCASGTLPSCTATPVIPGTALTPAQIATLTLTPAPGATIPVSQITFNYFATDNTGATSNEASVNVPVFTPAPKLPPVAQNLITDPVNTGSDKTPLPALLATDPQGSPITLYTINSAITSGLLYDCTSTCTALTNGSTFTDPSKLQFDADPQAGVLSAALVAGGFTYTATSENGVSNTAKVTIPVFNNAPVAQSMTTGPIPAGNTGATYPVPMLQGVDKDGTIASYTVNVPSAGGSLKYCAGAAPAVNCTPGLTVTAGTVLTPAQVATLVFVPTSTTVLTPNFTYTVTDNNGNVSNIAEVNIPITIGGTTPGGNLAPVSQDIIVPPVTNTSGAAYLPALAATDPDGTVSYYKITALPATGTLEYCPTSVTCAAATITAITYTNPANFRYTPLTTNTGSVVTFTYTAYDNLGLVSNVSNVTIPVTNPAPMAFNIVSNPVIPGTTLTPVSGPMAVDNGSILNYQFSSIPNAGTEGTLYYCNVAIPAPGCAPSAPVTTASLLTPAQAATLAFTPVASFNSNVSLNYTAKDNLSLASNTATLVIPVQKSKPGTGTPPVANDTVMAAISSNVAAPVAIPGAMTAKDADGTIAKYVIATLPAATQGVLSYCTSGTIAGNCSLTPVVAGVQIPAGQETTLSFLPNSSYAGPVNFTYTAIDNDGSVSNVANVHIPVKNLAPIASAVTVATVSPAGPAVPVIISATDPDGGSIATYTLSNVPPANQGTLNYCMSGTLPSCTATPVTPGTVLTPAQAATLTLTPATGMTIPVLQITFQYYATDNTGAASNEASVSVPVFTPAPKLPPVAQNLITDPVNTGSDKAPLPALLATDPQGSPITLYTINSAITSGLLYDCTSTCTALTNGSTFTDPSKLQFDADPQAGVLSAALVAGGFTYTATSENGVSNTAKVTIPVFNNAPVAQSMTSDPVLSGPSPVTVRIAPLQAADADGNIAATGYKVTVLPTLGTLKYCLTGDYPCSNGGGLTNVATTTLLSAAQVATLQYTAPATASNAVTTFSFTATDNNGNISNIAKVNIPLTKTATTTPVYNLPPVTQDITTAPITNTDGQKPLPALAGNDPDGVVTKYTIVAIPTAATGLLYYCNPTCGAALAANAVITDPSKLQFLPNPAFAGGNASFTYTATDNSNSATTGISNTSTVTIPVINPAPTALNVVTNVVPAEIKTPISGPMATDNGSITNYTITTAPDATKQGTLFYCLTPGTACSVTQPVVASTTLTSAQAATLAFTPVAVFTGTVTVPYTATDNNALVSSPAALIIPVQKPKSGTTGTPPVANDTVVVAINSNTVTPAALPGIMTATDVDGIGTIATYTINTLPSSAAGTLSYCTSGTLPGCTLTPVVAGNTIPAAQAGTLSFTPVNTYSGPVNFTYTAQDNTGLSSNVANVNIPVKNLPPVADATTTTPVKSGGTAVPVTILAKDPDGTVATYTVSTIPPATQGTLSYCTTGSLPTCTATTPVTAGTPISASQAATLMFTPSAGTIPSSGITFDYYATDNTGANSNQNNVTIPVYTTPATLPPVAQNLTTSPVNTASDKTVLPALVATDPQGSPITLYTVTSAITSGLLYDCTSACIPLTNGSTFTDPSKLQFDADPQAGIVSASLVPGKFTYTAASVNGTSNTATVTIPVFNNLPVATSMNTAPAKSGNPAGVVPVPVLMGADADGMVNSYKITILPTAAMGVLSTCSNNTTPCSGTLSAVVVNAALTPVQVAHLFFQPTASYTGTATFSFTVTDNNLGVSNVAEVFIPVTTNGVVPANLPPITQDINMAPIVNTDGQRAIPALAGQDPNGTITKYTVTAIPLAATGVLYYCNSSCIAVVANSTVITDPSKLQFAPNTTYTGGNASFTYTATDDYTTPATSNSSTVTIPILNPAPVAYNVLSSAIAPGATNAPVSGLVGTDNGSIQNYTFPNLPANGTLKYCNAGGTLPSCADLTVAAGSVLTPAQAATLVFTPAADFSGTVSIAYTAKDNLNAVSLAPGTLIIPVMKTAPVNQPPVAKNYAAVPMNSNAVAPATLPTAITATDPDIDGSVQNYTILTIPPATHGVLTYNSGTALAAGTVLTPAEAATIAFQPNAAYSGPVTFNYRAADNKDAISNVAVVTIPVVNLAPISQPVNTSVASGSIPLTLVAADADGGTIASYVINSVPPASEGTLTYCIGGTLPCSNTTLAGGEKLTPAEVATLTFNSVAFSPVSLVAFNYSAIDNTGSQGNMSPVSIKVSTPVALPVAITEYNATAVGCDVMVAWQTGVEANITGYTIEQSLDGTTYNKVGKVSPKGSNSRYVYTIKNAVNGKSMYRLEIGNDDGSYSYTQTATVMNECSGRSISVTMMPNPATSMATLMMNVPAGTYTLRMLSAQGQLILNKSVSVGDQIQKVPLENLDIYSRGAYLMIITDEHGQRIFTDRLMLH